MVGALHTEDEDQGKLGGRSDAYLCLCGDIQEGWLRRVC